jgi:hypothetical protein
MAFFNKTTGKFASELETLQAELDAIPARLAEFEHQYSQAQREADATDDLERRECRRLMKAIRASEARRDALPAEISAAQTEAERKAEAEAQRERTQNANSASQALGAVGAAVPEISDTLSRLRRQYAHLADRAASFRQLTGIDLADEISPHLEADFRAALNGEEPTALKAHWAEAHPGRKATVAQMRRSPAEIAADAEAARLAAERERHKAPLVMWPDGVARSCDARHRGRTYFEALEIAGREAWERIKQKWAEFQADQAHRAAVGAPTAAGVAADVYFDGRRWVRIPDRPGAQPSPLPADPRAERWFADHAEQAADAQSVAEAPVSDAPASEQRVSEAPQGVPASQVPSQRPSLPAGPVLDADAFAAALARDEQILRPGPRGEPDTTENTP